MSIRVAAKAPVTSLIPEITQFPDCGYAINDYTITESLTSDSVAILDALVVS